MLDRSRVVVEVGLGLALVVSLGLGVAAELRAGALESAMEAEQQQALEGLRAELTGTRAALEEHLSRVSERVESAAAAFADDPAAEDALPGHAGEHLADTPELHGYALAWVPEEPAAAPAPIFYVRGEGDEVELREAPADADLGTLTAPSAWYHEAVYEGAGWRSPFESISTPGEMILAYSTPFCRGGACEEGAEPDGVLSASIRLTGLEAILRGNNLGEDGETYLADEHGRLVVHPRMERVRSRMTLHEKAAMASDEDLARRYLAALREEAPDFDDGEQRDDQSTGRSEHFFSSALEGGEHFLFAHAAQQTAGSPETRRHRLVLGWLPWTTAGLLASLMLVWLGLADPTRRAWAASSLISVALLADIGLLWWATTEHPSVKTAESTRVVGAGDLASFEAGWERVSQARDLDDPAFVPTGIFLQSVEFQSANNVTVSGLVWQRMSCGDPVDEPDEEAGGPGPRAAHAASIDCAADDDELSPAFFFPEADPGEELMVDLAYRRPELGAQVLGWRFRALLRQDFNYDPYPFDRQEVWLRMLPTQFDANVVLVPDLLAYDRTHPESKPGIEAELILPGWEIRGSGFYYRWRDYDTDFGIHDYVGQSGFPELVYTVHISRAFLGPFVGKIIPLTVAAAMLFCMVLLGSRREGFAERFGFSALEVVLGAAALFFVVIFDHSALREDLATVRPFYLEYFYFGMYLALMFACVNAILFAMGRVQWIQRTDNLLPKVLFWPGYLVGLLLVTAVFFY